MRKAVRAAAEDDLLLELMQATTLWSRPRADARRRVWSLALLLCLALLVAGCGAKGTPGGAATASGGSAAASVSLVPEFDKAQIRSLVDGGSVVGMVVGVVTPRDSEFYAYGRTSLNGGHDIDEDTVFEIGSVGKLFTATLLADMVRRGEVAYDDPIERYLPPTVKAPTYRRRSIALIDLVTHTSGLPLLPENLSPSDELSPYADYTVRRLHAYLSHFVLARRPGSRYEYSNLAFGLLGHVLSLRSGLGYEDLVVGRVCNGLAMADTRATLTPGMRERLATGYRDGTAMPRWYNPTLAGAGDLRSTARDLLTFLAANMSIRHCGLADAMRVAQQPRVKVSATMRAGMGWHILNVQGTPIVECHGGTGGYRAFVGFVREAQTGVVLLTSTSFDVDYIAHDILSEAAAAR